MAAVTLIESCMKDSPSPDDGNCYSKLLCNSMKKTPSADDGSCYSKTVLKQYEG